MSPAREPASWVRRRTAGPTCRRDSVAEGCSAGRRGPAGREPSAACPSRTSGQPPARPRRISATRKYSDSPARIRMARSCGCLSQVWLFLISARREIRRDREGGVGQGDQREWDRGARPNAPADAERSRGRGIGPVDDDSLAKGAPQWFPRQRREIDAQQDGPDAEHPQGVCRGAVARLLIEAPDDDARRDERQTTVEHADAGQREPGGLADANGLLMTFYLRRRHTARLPLVPGTPKTALRSEVSRPCLR